MPPIKTILDVLYHVSAISFLGFFLAYCISIRTFPVIIYLSEKKNLMDSPEDRSSHSSKTPTLGGVGIFLTFSITLILMGIFNDLSQNDLIKLLSILGGVIILLFLGIKDDLIELSPKKKMVGQLLSSLIVVVTTDTRLDGLFGLFGSGELPYFVSVALSILIFIFIINAFNLVDGIDGLAGSISVLASLVFGIFFIINGNLLMALVSSILLGGVIGFLTFNLSEDQKLFMGDSGSMFIGFLLAYQAIGFLSMHETMEPSFLVPHPLILVASVLIYPILDTCRIFGVRILQGKSPFAADKNHIHHRLIHLGFSHRKATMAITSTLVVIIASTFLIGGLPLGVQLFFLFIVYPLVVLVPFLFNLEKGKITLIMPNIFK